MTKKFGDCLREIRIAKEMSQEQLAELLGTTKQVISKYETNQRTPKVTVANDYAIKLNVPLGALLGSGSNRFQPLRLKQYRLSVQESPEDVANKLGVSKHSYLGWEDGSITMFVEQIEDVAEYFGISTDYLYGYTDDPKAGVKGNEAQKKEALTVADDGLSKIKKDTINFINSLDDEQVQVLLDVAKSIYRERGE